LCKCTIRATDQSAADCLQNQLTWMSPAAASPVPRPATRIDPNAVLAFVALAQFMVVLDATVVN
jgi:hypothetical protein